MTGKLRFTGVKDCVGNSLYSVSIALKTKRKVRTFFAGVITNEQLNIIQPEGQL